MKKKVKTTCIVKFEDSEISVKLDKNDLVSLTDLWRKAGSPTTKRPYDWLCTKDAIEFVEHITRLNVGNSPRLEVKEGRSGGTFADVQIALKYAQWLSPDFQKDVNDIFIERHEEEMDPELGVQRAIERHKKRLTSMGKDETSIKKRLRTVWYRNTLTETLGKHGVGHGDRGYEFASVTNAEYQGWKGQTANEIKDTMNLDKKANLRDHLSDFELDQLYFLESVLEEKIKRDNIYGGKDACKTAHHVGKTVANMVSGVMRIAIE